MRRIALVDINATGRNVGRVKSPSFIANAERFLSFGLTVGIFTTLDIRTRGLAVYPRGRSDESGFTVTTKGTGCVDAHR